MADPLIMLYRADWTRWSFSAEVVTRRNDLTVRSLADRTVAEFWRRTSGSPPAPLRRVPGGAEPEWSSFTARILIAPGGRYRYQPAIDADRLAESEELENNELVTLVLSDGEFCWVVRSAEADRTKADRSRNLIDRIARPDWLMSQLRLTLTGQTELAGRSMLMVRGTPRPRANRFAGPIAVLDWVDFLVDAELGVVLRRQARYQGEPLSVFELRNFTVDPAAASDPASFRPDDGIEIDEDDYYPDTSARRWSSADWHPAGDDDDEAVGLAATVAKGALYLAARSVSRPEPGPEQADDEAEFPQAGQELPATEPVTDDTLRLIAQVDRPAVSISAEVHQWIDANRAIAARPNLVTDSDENDRPAATHFIGTEDGPLDQRLNAHRVARLRAAMPDRYRIDYLLDKRTRHPKIIACDGERVRKIYHNRVIASPARTLPTDFIRLIDPSWLLVDWQLTQGSQEYVEGRAAIRVQAVPPDRQPWPPLDDPPTRTRIDLLIDAELGIILRQVSYAGDEPVARIEVRELTIVPEVNPLEFGSAIAPDLPVTSTNGDPALDLDLPPVAKSIRDVSSGLAALFRRPR